MHGGFVRSMRNEPGACTKALVATFQVSTARDLSSGAAVPSFVAASLVELQAYPSSQHCQHCPLATES